MKSTTEQMRVKNVLKREFITKVKCEEIFQGTERPNILKKIRRYYTTEDALIGELFISFVKLQEIAQQHAPQLSDSKEQ